MKTMILNELCGLEENQAPLKLTELPDPIPSANEILIRVSACGVCHTELDEIEGRIHTPVHLWLEKEIKSVANICRKDASEFLALAAEMRIKPEIQEFALEDANEALVELKTRRIRGAKVLKLY